MINLSNDYILEDDTKIDNSSLDFPLDLRVI